MKGELGGREAPLDPPKHPRGRDVIEAKRKGCLAQSTAVGLKPNNDHGRRTWRPMGTLERVTT